MPVIQNALPRTALNGPLVVVDNATAAAPTVIQRGFLLDANGALVTLATGTPVMREGFMRDAATYALLCTDEATATGIVMRESLPRDGNGFLVTTTNAQAVFQRGFALDAAGNVCVTGTI